MRCKACDARLTPREATRKCAGTGEYPDLCDGCMSTIMDDVQLEDSPIFSNREEDDNELSPDIPPMSIW
jgi:hypothetical protein